MWRHGSLCGCIRFAWPAASLGDERAKRFRALQAVHYRDRPECRRRAEESLVWRSRVEAKSGV
jgi:hypothetical protein